MAITIHRLVCNVSVKTKEKKSPLSKDPKAKKPDLHFRAPQPASGQAPPVGSATATEDKGGAADRAPVSATGADPNRVAELVYGLMKEEVRLGRLRGEHH